MTADTIRRAATTDGGGPVLSGLPVLAHVLRESRRSVGLWAIAVAAVASLYTASWPAVGGSKADVVAALPPGLVTALGLGEIGTPGGYLSSTVYGILGPALLLVSAIGRAAAVLAGEEQDGTLELELTHPVSRTRVYAERLLGVWVCSAALAAALTLAVAVVGVAVGLDEPLPDLLAGSAGLLLLTLAMGTVSFAVGAATGRRATALGVAAGIAVLAYAANALGALSGSGWLADVSPWSWYLGGRPLSTGFDGLGLLRLAVLLAVAATAGLLRFRRRDLGT